MLKPPQSLGANICLRCELRLIQRTLRGPSSLQHRIASLSTTAHRLGDSQTTQHQRIRKVRDYSVTKTKDGEAIYKHIYPQGRIRGRRGREVREESAQLEMKSLGEPSEIIVLKNADLDRGDPGDDPDGEAKQDTVKEYSKPSTDPQDILKAIEDQKIAPTQADVNTNIEALRCEAIGPHDGQSYHISAGQFERTRLRLAESYSRKQLMDYVHYIQPWKDTVVEHRKQLLKASPVMSRSEWIPRPLCDRLTRLPTSDDIFSKQHAGKSAQKKKHLAGQIITYCWNMQVQGHEGDLEMQLPHPLMDLLKAGTSPNTLDHLRQQTGLRTAVIDAGSSGKWLRIRGTFDAATRAGDDIVAWLSHLKTRRLDLTGLRSWIGRGRKRDPQYFTVAHLSRALRHLRIGLAFGSGHSIQTQRPPDASAAEHLLTITAFNDAELDNTQQMILQLLDIPGAGNYAAVLGSFLNPVSLPVPINTTALVKHTKLMTLRRNKSDVQENPVRASGKSESSTTHDLATLLGEKLESALRGGSCSLGSSSRDDPDNASRFWSQAPEQSLSATTGLYVHYESPKQVSKIVSSKVNQSSKTLEETLVTQRLKNQPFDKFVPDASYAFSWLTNAFKSQTSRLVGPRSTISELQFDFIPTPFTTVRPTPSQVRARISLHFNKQPGTGSWIFSRWCAHLGTIDVIVPLEHLATDLRFSKSFELLSTESGNDQLHSYVQSVQDTIAKGGTLAAPSSIEAIAPHLPSLAKDDDPLGSGWSNDWTIGSSKPTTYLFAGVQFKQILNLAWSPVDEDEQYALTYTVVDRGTLRGRSTELTLGLPTNVAIQDESQAAQEARMRFYTAATDLATQLTAAGKTNVTKGTA